MILAMLAGTLEFEEEPLVSPPLPTDRSHRDSAIRKSFVIRSQRGCKFRRLLVPSSLPILEFRQFRFACGRYLLLSRVIKERVELVKLLLCDRVIFVGMTLCATRR